MLEGLKGSTQVDCYRNRQLELWQQGDASGASDHWTQDRYCINVLEPTIDLTLSEDDSERRAAGGHTASLVKGPESCGDGAPWWPVLWNF